MRAQRGFTLLEVMLGLALLGLALTVMIKFAAGSIMNAEEARMMGVASDLARGKMYDVEEQLLKDGFTETDQSDCDKDFSDEGWPNVKYCAKVEQVEMPNFDDLQKMMLGQGSGAMGSGSGAGSGMGSGGGGFADSALGGMLGMFGGGGKDVTAMQGGSLIQSQYSMFQQILKVSIRKVSLTVSWKVLGHDRDMKVVEFLTDPGAMDKVINGLGSQELPDTGAGSGAMGTGGAGSTKPTIPGRPTK